MSVLVDDLLVLARLDRERPLDLGRIDLVAWPAAPWRRPGPRPRTTRSRSWRRPALAMVGDAARLRQVVDNLLVNAASATRPHGRREVARRGEADASRRRHRGGGPRPRGPPTRRRGSSSPSSGPIRSGARTTGGAGLGLAIVAAIARAHGGTVGVRPNRAGGPVFGCGSRPTPRRPDLTDGEPPSSDDLRPPAGADRPAAVARPRRRRRGTSARPRGCTIAAVSASKMRSFRHRGAVRPASGGSARYGGERRSHPASVLLRALPPAAGRPRWGDVLRTPTHLGDSGVLLLLGVGFVGGLVTALSPCIIPVLPVIAAGGVGRGRPGRPFAIIGGMVASFTAFTLAGGELLSLLHLPQDLLRDLGIAMLFLAGRRPVVPAWVTCSSGPSPGWARGAPVAGGTANGTVLGVEPGSGLRALRRSGPGGDLGRRRPPTGWGSTAVLLTAGLRPGRRGAAPGTCHRGPTAPPPAARRCGRTCRSVRRVAGVVLALTALRPRLQPHHAAHGSMPGYATRSRTARAGRRGRERSCSDLTGEHGRTSPPARAAAAGPCPSWARPRRSPGSPAGSTPPATARSRWPGCGARSSWSTSGPTRASTASASSPTSRPGTRSTTGYGLEVVGVHTPEFPFEYVVSNVQAAVGRLGVRLPGGHRRQLQDLGRLRQRVLAGRVPDRPERRGAPHRLRRGRLRRQPRATSGSCWRPAGPPPPAADRRAQPHARPADSPQRPTSAHALRRRALPRLAGAREPGRPSYQRPPDLPLGRVLASGGPGPRTPGRSRPGRGPSSTSTTWPTTSTWCSGAPARSRCR